MRKLFSLITTAIMLVSLLAAPSFAQQRRVTNKLHWQDNADNESYTGIYRSNSLEGPFTEVFKLVGADLVDYSETVETVEGALWCYYVTAGNVTGESVASNTACKTVPIQIPNGHTSLTFTQEINTK